MSIDLCETLFSNAFTTHKSDITRTLTALSDAAIEIANLCAFGPLEQSFGALAGSSNSDGDDQKALDVRTDEIITAALTRAPVAYYASEEQDGLVTFDPSQPLSVASDPLDGSSNIDTNVSIGTIFSIYDTKDSAHASFFRKGSDQLVGGFFVYGPQTSLVITAGNGTQLYVLDRAAKRFKLAIAKMDISTDKALSNAEFAINASNQHIWQEPVRNYIGDCLLGAHGPLGAKHNMRWIGSLVADANRILMRGGIFLYPADDRDGYAAGRLRLLYEAAPVAFIIEQAGGLATNGQTPIMDITLSELHQRVPLVFGTKPMVSKVATYFTT